MMKKKTFNKIKTEKRFLEIVDKVNSTKEKLKEVSTKFEKLKNPNSMMSIKNLLSSTLNITKEGFKLADDNTINTRQALCLACEFWESTTHKKFGKCSKCNCTSARLKMQMQKCPLGKW